jgi:hypothetical protein
MTTGYQADRFSVRDFGALGDGTHLDTTAIQAAIEACHRSGGGTVVLPSGTYLSGTVQLKSNVTLYLAAQARLLGSPDLKDYPELSSVDQLYQSGGYSLLAAINAENIGLSGQGTIDGQGAAFPCGAEGFNFEDEAAAPSTQSFIRPMLVHFLECSRVTMRGVTLQHSASWGCHIEKCQYVRLDGVRLFNRANQNNDGFDLTYCKDVFASNCSIDCGDDAFALKEGGERIVITNCVISTRWAAFRVGPEAHGVYRDITVSNCVVRNTYGAGIKMQEVEGGVMEDILFDNLVMDNVTGPISIRLGGYLGWKKERKESLPIGVLRNVRFNNIRATVADNAYPLPHEVPPFPGEKKSCINITGVPGYYVEGVTLSHIHVTFPGGGTLEDAGVIVPELRDHYPEYHMFGTLPAYGLYVRHARGIILDDVTFDTASPDLRPALVCDDVLDLELADFRAAATPGTDCMVRLRDTRGAFIHGCRLLNEVDTFLNLEGAASQEITLSGNDLHKAGMPVRLADGASASTLQE